jgi:hypothetical protein
LRRTLAYLSYVAELLIPFRAVVSNELPASLFTDRKPSLICQGSPAKRNAWSAHFMFK